MALERRLVELREVPQRDRHRKERTGDERTCGPAPEPEHPAGPNEGPDHPRGRPVKQQRREDEREDEMLHHVRAEEVDRKSTRLNSSHSQKSYAVFCLKKKKSIYVRHISIRVIELVKIGFYSNLLAV